MMIGDTNARSFLLFRSLKFDEEDKEEINVNEIFGVRKTMPTQRGSHITYVLYVLSEQHQPTTTDFKINFSNFFRRISK
jgi:hypothetical protein